MFYHGISFQTVPQIRLALSRGFAVGGLFEIDITQGGALGGSATCQNSRFALGYYRSPLQGFSQLV
jgi:hypothetical protein